MLAALNHLPQRMCLDSRLHAVVALHLLVGLAAVISHILVVADNHLVAAASECKINRHSGVLVILGVGIAADADTDAERHCHLIADFYRLDVLNDAETILPELSEILILKDNKILVILDLSDERINLCKVFVHLPVN